MLGEPFDVMDSGRMAAFADSEGAPFAVWQPRQHRGAQLVNEPGALNFNSLNTRDAAAARAFYGAVFGWETMQLEGGAEMWTLPGYGEHLEQLNPGTRQRTAEMGVPGFEEVIAAMLPVPEDQHEVRAHWSVTFGTDDADATAARVSELGGTVIAPAFDRPWVRMTVFADPQGAVLTASKFVPENRDL